MIALVLKLEAQKGVIKRLRVILVLSPSLAARYEDLTIKYEIIWSQLLC